MAKNQTTENAQDPTLIPADPPATRRRRSTVSAALNAQNAIVRLLSPLDPEQRKAAIRGANVFLGDAS